MPSAALAIARPPLRRALRLADYRSRTSGHWRVALAIATTLSLYHTAATIILATHGLGSQVHPITTRTAVLVAWVCGTIMALHSASDRADKDRADGIDALARIHGIDHRTLSIGQMCAPGFRTAAIIVVACTPVFIASIAAAPSFSAAAMRLASVLPLIAFSLAVGVVVGPLAGACGWLAGRHGRTVLIAAVIIPWSINSMTTSARGHIASIPGALSYLANLISSIGACR